MERDPNTTRPPWLPAFLIALAIAGLFRAAALVFIGGALSEAGTLTRDDDAYRMIAENVAQRGEFSRTRPDQPAVPTAFRPPLYPLLLSCLASGGHVASLPIAALHLLLGLGTVAATFALARQFDFGPWAACGVGVCVGIDPLLVNQSTLVMTETLATFLAVLSGLMLTRLVRQGSLLTAVGTGAALTAAVLCRPTFLVWVAFSLPAILLLSVTTRQGLAAVAIVLACIVVGLTPWVYRNQQQLGKPIVATTHGGYTLLLGNNAHFYAFLRDPRGRTVWDAEELHATMRAAQVDAAALPADEHLEVIQDRLCYQEAWSAMSAAPASCGFSCLVRVARLWRPLPYRLAANESPRRTALRYATCVWYCLVYGCVGIACVCCRRQWLRSPWVWGLLFCLSITLVHTFYWSNIRMRAPAMPFVYCAAAAGVGWIVTTCVRARQSAQ